MVLDRGFVSFAYIKKKGNPSITTHFKETIGIGNHLPSVSSCMYSTVNYRERESMQ